MTNLAGCYQANGLLGAYLKLAGFDGFLIQGAASHWVCLFIHDVKGDLRNARHLEGNGTFETEKSFLGEVGLRRRGCAQCIGPAGEKLVRLAMISGDGGHVVAHNIMGEVVKLANNTITTVTAVATAGAIGLATKAGVELEKFLKVIQSGTANSWVAQNWDYWRKKVKGETTDFEITYKDLSLALDLAKAYAIPLPLSEVIAHLDMAKVIASSEN